MVYLLLAIACSFSMSLMMRFFGKDIKNPMAMYMSNYVVCILLATMFIGHLDFSLPHMSSPLIIGAISGALYLLSLQAYDSNIGRNGLSMAATFNKLGILVPTLMAIFVFHETMKLTQLFGFTLALFSIVYLYSDKESAGLVKNKGLLIYLLLVAGICDSMANIYENIGVSELKNYFLLFNFLFACIFSFGTLLVQRKPVQLKDFAVGALIGIPNYLSSRFCLYALSQLSAIVVYPVYSVSVLVLLNISGVLFFKEAMNRKKGITIALICIALALLNL